MFPYNISVLLFKVRFECKAFIFTTVFVYSPHSASIDTVCTICDTEQWSHFAHLPGFCCKCFVVLCVAVFSTPCTRSTHFCLCARFTSLNVLAAGLCGVNSNQLTSLGISLWPTAQEATVGSWKSFLDRSLFLIKCHKDINWHPDMHVDTNT